jgi:hypothetical protein
VTELTELLDAAASWESLVAVLLVFGLAPGLVLRSMLLLYPKEHPRRAELLAEFKVIKRPIRPLWVAEIISVCLFEGLGERSKARALQRRRRHLRGPTARTARDWLFVPDPASMLLQSLLLPLALFSFFGGLLSMFLGHTLAYSVSAVVVVTTATGSFIVYRRRRQRPRDLPELDPTSRGEGE